MLPLCLKREAVLLAIFFASDDNLVKVLRKLLPNMIRFFYEVVRIWCYNRGYS